MKVVLLISVLVTVLIIAAVSPAATFAESPQEYTKAELEWSQANYKVTNGTGTAKIILSDPDVPNIPSYIDTVKVLVFSDSSREGIVLKLYETGKNTGVFERTFAFSDKRSAPNVLYASEGDTATARYVDDTLPSDSESDSVDLTATTLLGLTGPPMERAPITNARIVDISGNSPSTVVLGEQIQIFSDIANNQNREQKFVWIAQITDSSRETVSLGWIDGVLYNKTSFSPSLSWIPENYGQYTATMFAWESIDNPTALSPPVRIEFTVAKEKPEPKKPEKEITITVGDAIRKDGLLPITTTEITTNTESLDSVTDWHFLPLNHGEWGPSGNDRASWDALPNENRQFISTGKANGEQVDFDASHFRDAILRTYDADCRGEKIEILSADPVSVAIPEKMSSVSITISDSGLLPVDGLYTLRFASFFDQDVMLPENAVIVSSEQKRCSVNHEEYSSGQYVKVVFKLESYPDDFEFKYSFGVGEKNLYDSKNGLYVTDMVCDDPLVTPVPLTETEKTIIWESISGNNFFQMSNYTQNCDEFGNCIGIEPESRITLFVAADGIKHSVSYRDSYIGKNGEAFSRFDTIIDTINGIFEDKEELKFLPKPRCGYL